MSTAFIQAAVILLREGLEAMLVIAALAGYLTKAGASDRINALYGGALAAVGTSIVAAWLFAAAAFLAVFREGAETVLFINALATTEGGWSAGLFVGLGAATVGLLVL